MNSFQILDPNNSPIPIIRLDAEAAKFWNVKLQPKGYAAPKCTLGHWYDNIGWAISYHSRLDYGLNTWNSIKQYMLETHTGMFVVLSPEEAGIQMCNLMRNCKPYFDLIDHWAAMDYKPKQIKD